MRDYEDYRRVGDTFPARFDGRCAVDKTHRIKRKDLVSFVELRENPHIVIEGPACKSCTAVMDR